MRFMMMYKPERNVEAGVPPDPQYLADMDTFIEQMTASGALLDTAGLQPSAKGARVRASAGKVTVTDGPFTESKELVAGYAVVQAKSKEEAIQLARRFLAVAGDGETEIRQLYEPSDFNPGPV
jgi:hypothetical protein